MYHNIKALSLALTQSDSLTYEPGAIVPDLRRDPEAVDLAQFKFLRLFRIDAEIHRDVQQIPPLEGNEFLREMFRTCGAQSVELLGCRRSIGGLLTTSFASESGQLIGIHLDNWFALPLSSRESSPTRLTVNIGPDTHWLLFVPVPVCSLLSSEMSTMIPHTRDVRNALACELAQYKCIAARLDPGMGYILNTELYPHDGSTMWSLSGSTILSLSIEEREIDIALESEVCTQASA